MPSHDDFVNTIAMPNAGNGVMQNYTQLFTYDKLGNLQNMQSLSRWTRNYFYNSADNKLLVHTQNTTEYTYDAHGNMLTMPHLTGMSWDFQNRLFSATNGTVTSFYNYDATGNRARKTVEKAGNIREERYYIGNYEVYRKFISETLDFERLSLHVSDGTKKFATIETKTIENGEQITNPTSVIRYQYDNHLGSACLELDENAAIISYEEYHPFGTTSYRSGRTETEVSLKRYKYVGKERDEETGLYYYGARYYAGWIARFVSVDPLQHKYPELTPFQYASNNPVTMIDIDGMEGGKPEDKTNMLPEVTVSASGSWTENLKVKWGKGSNGTETGSFNLGGINITGTNYHFTNSQGQEVPSNEVAGFYSNMKSGNITASDIGYSYSLHSDQKSLFINQIYNDKIDRQEKLLQTGVDVAQNLYTIALFHAGGTLLKGLNANIEKLDSKKTLNFALNRGSGPVPGVLEVSPNVKSVAQFNKFNPKNAVEFVFDSKTNVFAVGKVKYSIKGLSPHQNLAKSIGADNSVVGGMLKRGLNGDIITNEASGHFFQNWSPEIRNQYQNTLKSLTGKNVYHAPGPSF